MSTERCVSTEKVLHVPCKDPSVKGAHFVYERYDRPFMKASFMSLMRR